MRKDKEKVKGMAYRAKPKSCLFPLYFLSEQVEGGGVGVGGSRVLEGEKKGRGTRGRGVKRDNISDKAYGRRGWGSEGKGWG